MQVYRSITLVSAAGKFRTAEFNGKEHLVLPVVGLVEGVIQAMNAPAPELVLAEKFSIAPSGWNGRPVFLNHPVEGGRPISGNSPEVLTRSIGLVFNANISGKRLLMEAWLDEAKAKELGGEEAELVERVRANKKIEISTGAFILLEDKKGDWNGTAYDGVWDVIIPDHLALLSEGATGACSYKMGCGVRAAVAYDIGDNNKVQPLYALESTMHWSDQFRTLRGIPQAERDKMPALDFAGPNRSFPIAEPEDVEVTLSTLKGLKDATQGERDRVRRKTLAIAKRKGKPFMDKLPEDAKPKAEPKASASPSFLRRLTQFFALQDPEDMSDSDLRDELRYALGLIDSSFRYSGDITAVYPQKGMFVYQMYESEGVVYYRRSYTVDASGEATVGDTAVECERVISYEPSEPEDELTAALAKIVALAGARHSNKDQKMVQTLHDTSASLGAVCAGMKASSTPCGCGQAAATQPAEW